MPRPKEKRPKNSERERERVFSLYSLAVFILKNGKVLSVRSPPVFRGRFVESA